MLTRRALIVRGGTASAGVVFLWPGQAEAEAAGPLLATTKSIPLGGGRVIKGKYVITHPKKGVYRCFSAICTHQGCAVASVSRGTINCPCHGSKFSASTGAVVNGPAKRPLARKKIKVSKGKIRLA
ncbi:ubiquinol-cytochrome c reductase iron-sulfur subunit [Nonomuraea basaltis]|uniref:QcrA and Rieske domain-containing protein n=1 Tax=Nonomuraea basaltis TaxID=2495887 RepID=UPI00110C4D5F|nr:Rieske (2Fe-2S) protein [Nonomuraea basaltis]TMR99393.1 Rieske (2Fe-2S) protein [Nonomuraea basaltis]